MGAANLHEPDRLAAAVFDSRHQVMGNVRIPVFFDMLHTYLNLSSYKCCKSLFESTLPEDFVGTG
jgi:hypothetical protein